VARATTCGSNLTPPAAARESLIRPVTVLTLMPVVIQHRPHPVGVQRPENPVHQLRHHQLRGDP